jgi:ankyrin repeat protein
MNDLADRDLLEAALIGDLPSIEEALCKGADINIRDSNGDTALGIAASWGFIDIVEYLLKNGALLSLANDYYMTPLHLASVNGNVPMVQLLLKKININEFEGISETLSEIIYICSASKLPSPEVISMLRKYQAGLSVPKAGGIRDFNTLLLKAVNEGDYAGCEEAIGNGANVDATDEEGASVLRLACRKGYAEIAGLLLASGADVNKRSKTGWTALMEASAEGYANLADIIIGHGAAVNAKTYVSGTALIFASRGGHTDTVRILLLHGADRSIRISKTAIDAGKDALIVARENGHEEIVRLLEDFSD